MRRNPIKSGVAAIAASSAVLWLTACSASGLPLDVPAEAALDRLKTSHRVVEGTGMGSLTLNGEGRPAADTVKLSVARAGEPRKARCLVIITAVSATRSQARLDCTQPGPSNDPNRALAVKALEIVVSEHVLASAQNRPYNIDRVADRMLAFMAVSAPALAARITSPPTEEHTAPIRSTDAPATFMPDPEETLSALSNSELEVAR